MGSASRRKGADGERELASLLPGAYKISGMYQPGADCLWRERLVEVKRRKEGFRFDYKHLEDVEILAKREDRNDWLLTMKIDTLIDLMDEAYDRGFAKEGLWDLQ